MKNKDTGMTRVIYDGEKIGEVMTNHTMTVWDALELIGIDPNEIIDGECKYNLELFELVYII